MDDSEKKIKGVGIYTLVLLGISISSIEARLAYFFDTTLGKKFMLEDLKSKLSLGKEKDKEIISKEMNNIKKRLTSINDRIININENVLSPLNLEKKLSTLDINYLLKIIKERLSYVHKTDETINLIDKTFDLSLYKEIQKINSSLGELMNFLKEKEDFEGIKKIDENYRQDIRESTNIFSIGYGRTAVLCIGRTIEKIINNYLRKLLEKQKITQKEFDEFIGNKYNNKIGFLKSKFIDEEEYSKLKAFSFDRDKGGHADLGEIDNERARTLIQQGIWLIVDLQNKIKEVKSDEEKAREILGGRSSAGLPSLYGTPEQKLERLKGYSGKDIEKMREEIIKEVEENKKS